MSEENKARVMEMIELLDSGRTREWAPYFMENATLRFGNADTMHGRDEIIENLVKYDDMLKYSHDIRLMIAEGDVVGFHTYTTYTTAAGVYTFPGAAFITFRDGLVADYQIMVDMTPMTQAMSAMTV